MKTINFYYRVKKYGTWKEASIETNIPNLSQKELLHICQQEVNENAVQVSFENPSNF